MHGPARRLPPPFMHVDNFLRQCAGALAADRAAPLKPPRRFRFAMYPSVRVCALRVNQLNFARIAAPIMAKDSSSTSGSMRSTTSSICPATKTSKHGTVMFAVVMCWYAE